MGAVAVVFYLVGREHGISKANQQVGSANREREFWRNIASQQSEEISRIRAGVPQLPADSTMTRGLGELTPGVVTSVTWNKKGTK
jgi:hypothetical protein